MERQFETKTVLILYILAVWRLSSLLVREEGPGDIFGKLRSKAGVKYDAHSRPYGENFLAKLLSCVLCVSLWISIIFVICDKLTRRVVVYLSLPLALSAGAIYWDSQVRRGT